MHFINGFLIGYFWRYIVAFALIFGTMAGISYLSMDKSIEYNFALSFLVMLGALPLLACLLHKYTMWRAGRASALFSVLRGLYGFYLLVSTGFAAALYFMGDKFEARAIPPEEAAAIKKMLKNDSLAETIINLPTYLVWLLSSIPILIVFILMSAYGRKIMRKHAQFLFDRDAAVVAQGVRQAMSEG